MAKIIVTEFISLDGVMEAPGGGESYKHGGWTFQINRGAEGEKFKLDETLSTEASLGNRSKPTLREYSEEFLRHLKSRAHVSKRDQVQNFRNIINDFARSIRKDFIQECREKNIPITQPNLSGDCSRLFSDRLDRFERDISRSGKNPNFKRMNPKALAKIYPGVTASIAREVFSRTKPSSAQMQRLVTLLHASALADIISDDFTGIVIAGYGSREHYPAIISHQIDGIFANRLKNIENQQSKVTRDNPALVAPFARREAANLFMEGVDYIYQQEINESATDLIVGLAELSAKYFGITNKAKIGKFKTTLKKAAEYYVKKLYRMRIGEAGKVLRAIQFLDKSEMAGLAENIVSLTALKQKVSLETETVGGLIDVAFISKHDGFIWIKRKHYFDADINPFFFERYLNATKSHN